jgi:hypothetical protein
MQEIVIEVQTLAALWPELEPVRFPVAVNLKGLTGFDVFQEHPQKGQAIAHALGIEQPA